MFLIFNHSYNNYIGSLKKGIYLYHLYEDGYVRHSILQGVIKQTINNTYTDGDISNDLTITYRQSKLDTSKYRLEIAANSAIFEGLYITTLNVKLPIDFANNSGYGFSTHVVYPNYADSDEYFTINDDGTWGGLGTVSSTSDSLIINFDEDGNLIYQTANTLDEYLAIKRDNLTVVDGGNYLAFTNSNNDSIISVTVDSDVSTDKLFELKAVDSNSDDPGQDNVFIDGIYDFTLQS